MCGCSTTVTTPTDTAISGATFRVEDMSCSHCVGTIRGALQAGLPGAAIAIDLDTKRVTVAGDPAAAEAIIRDAGYEPERLAG